MAWVEIADASHEENIPLIYDPQTSGGLRIALPPEPAQRLVDDLRARGNNITAIFGRVTAKDAGRPEGRLIITNSSLSTTP